MLKKIQSAYFFKILFNYIDERQKLKIVKCNKSIQKNIDISIINYKFFLGKYIIYESNGIGKEYDGDSGALIFEGEYLNGERNGKGKEYDWVTGELLFEGEYLKGKRNGKGKEYYYGKLFFEGEYFNDLRLKGTGYIDEIIIFTLSNNINGKWKDYNEEGKKVFDGEYLKGKINGKVKEYYNNGKLKFEGEYKNGNKHGKVKEYFLDGKLKFEGEYKNGLKWNGKEYDPLNNIVYELKDGKGLIKEYNKYCQLEFEGEYLNGQRNGKGKEYEYRSLIYEGEYLYGQRNGKGKEYWTDGKLKFEGEYLNGQRNGKGKEYYYTGELSFEGEYLYNNKFEGRYYINNNLEYEGEFLYDKKWNGKGYDENGNIIYKLINGNGKVKEYNEDGILFFEGEYLNGKKNGKAKVYSYKVGKGKQKYYKLIDVCEEEYLNGEMILEESLE